MKAERKSGAAAWPNALFEPASPPTFVDAREIALRPYQGSVVERLREKIRQRIKRLILCATTGAGKTLISAYLIKEAAKKGSQ